MNSHARRRFDSAESAHLSWITRYGRLAGLDLSAEGGALQFTTLSVARHLITHAQGENLRLTWTRRRLAGHDRCVFLFVNRGRVQIDGHPDQWAGIGGGFSLILPGIEPVTFHVSQPSEVIVLSCDRRDIEPVTFNARTVTTAIPPPSLLRAIYRFLEAVVQQHSSSTDDDLALAATLDPTIREMVRALSAAIGSSCATSSAFERAQRILHDRFADPAFTLEELARRCDVSRRTLNRMFAERGLKASRELRRLRAHRAEELCAGGNPRTVEAIAAASGFRTVTTMRRALLAEAASRSECVQALAQP